MEKTIGMRIKECRMKLGMTQQDLADSLQKAVESKIKQLKMQLNAINRPKPAQNMVMSPYYWTMTNLYCNQSKKLRLVYEK